MKRLNVRLVVWLGISLALLVIVSWVVHGYQSKKNSGLLKTWALEANERGDKPEMVRMLHRYLRYHPDDIEAVEQFTLTVAEIAEGPEATTNTKINAFNVMQNTLRNHPELHDVRRQLASFLISMGRPKDAQQHLEVLRETYTEDAEIERLLGQCEIGNGNFEAAAELLRQAIEHDPHDIDTYRMLAGLLGGRLGQPQAVEELMNDMIAANAETARAYMVRASFYRSRNRTEESQADIHKALDLKPDDVDVLLTAAELANTEGRREEVREYLERAAQKHPKNELVQLALARVELIEQRTDDAINRLEKALVDSPKSPTILFLLGELYLQRGEDEKLRDVLSRLTAANVSPERVHFLRARVMMSELKWSQALRLLERIRPVLATTELGAQTELLLSRCYAATGQRDLQIDALRRALASRPDMQQARIELSQALAASGRIDEALNTYETLSDTARQQFAGQEFQLMVTRNRLLPETERDWSATDAMLEQILQERPDDPAAATLRVSYYLQKGADDDARQAVAEAREKFPDEPSIWLLDAEYTAQTESPAAAMPILDELEQRLGRTLQTIMARVNLLVVIGGEETNTKLRAVYDELGDLPEDQRLQVVRRLGDAHYALRDYERAEELLTEVADARPDAMQVRLTLFTLARDRGSDEAMRNVLEQIRTISGEESSYYLFAQAARLVTLVAAGERGEEDLLVARRQLDTVASMRTDWAATSRLQGEIDERLGNLDSAIERYQSAVEKGDNHPLLLQRLVRLLVLRDRYEEADALLARLPNRDQLVTDRLNAELNLQLGRLPEALADAEEEIRRKPDDYQTWLWLGQIAARAGETNRAEEAFRKALELADDVPATWVNLIVHLIASGQREQAVALIDEAKQKLPVDTSALAIAQCYEVLEDLEAAKEGYLSALAAKPNDIPTLRTVAAFFTRQEDVELSVKYLTELIEKGAPLDEFTATVGWARREMARITASTGRYPDFLEALEWVDQNARDGKLGPEDLAIKARLMASRNDVRLRRDAIRLFEELLAIQPARDSDRELLAQLYEADDNWRDAKRHMQILVATSAASRDQGGTGNPRLVAQYAAMLLAHNEADEADGVVRTLEAMDAEGYTTPPGLKALLFVKQGKIDDAISLLEGQIERPIAPEQLDLLAQIAIQLESLANETPRQKEKLYTAAERSYRELATERETDRIRLAAFLGRHGDLDEFLNVCEQVVESRAYEAASRVLVASLRPRRLEVTPQQYARVEAMMQKGQAELPDSIPLFLMRADFYDIQGRYQDAAQVYRQLLARSDLRGGDRAAALNNLAFTLAVGERNASEAKPLIDEAISLVGELPELLDTRGAVALVSGNVQAAVRDFERAVESSPTGIKYFHLAQAQLAAGDRLSAESSFQKAVELGLDEDSISPMELDEYLRVRDALKA